MKISLPRRKDPFHKWRPHEFQSLYRKKYVIQVRSFIGTEDFDLLTGRKGNAGRLALLMFSYAIIYYMVIFLTDIREPLMTIASIIISMGMMLNCYSNDKRSKFWKKHTSGDDNGIYELRKVR